MRTAGTSLAALVPELKDLSEAILPSDSDWTGASDANALPPNFAPRLAKRLLSELALYLGGIPFNPLIHVVWDKPDEGQPVQSLLRICWPRYVPYKAPPMLVLDASADPRLLAKAMPPLEVAGAIAEPPFPPSVRVYQLADKRVTKSTLEISPSVAKTRLPDDLTPKLVSLASRVQP